MYIYIVRIDSSRCSSTHMDLRGLWVFPCWQETWPSTEFWSDTLSIIITHYIWAMQVRLCELNKPLFPTICTEEKMDCMVIQLWFVCKIRRNHLPNACISVRKSPRLNWMSLLIQILVQSARLRCLPTAIQPF